MGAATPGRKMELCKDRVNHPDVLLHTTVAVGSQDMSPLPDNQSALLHIPGAINEPRMCASWLRASLRPRLQQHSAKLRARPGTVGKPCPGPARHGACRMRTVEKLAKRSVSQAAPYCKHP